MNDQTVVVGSRRCHGYEIAVLRDDGVYLVRVMGAGVMSPTMAALLAETIRETAADARRWQIEDDSGAHCFTPLAAHDALTGDKK